MKTTITLRVLFLLIFQFTTIAMFAVDADGDSVTDTIEGTDGTDPNDPCDFYQASQVIANVTTAWNNLDCDGDGVTNGTEVIDGTDYINFCDYISTSITLTQTGLGYVSDCDGDGVANSQEITDGTDPFDPCSFLTSSQVLGNITVAWNALDCDGDGTLNGVDSDPFDPCVDDGLVGDENTTNLVWMAADCDGDSVANGIEVNTDSTDFNDMCSFLLTSIIPTITSPNWNSADCDGDGVTNSNELTNITDPLDPCDFLLSSITLTPTVSCALNTITGNIKLDYNSNGCDAADFPIGGLLVTSTDGTTTFSTFTDGNGDYVQNTNAGTFSSSASGFSSSYSATPNTQSTTFVGNGNTDTIDFCIAPMTTVNDLNITLIPIINAVPGNTVDYQLVYKNVGNTVVNGSVTFNFDGVKLTHQSSTPTADVTTTNALTYNFTALNPYEVRSVNVTFLVSSATVGDFLVYTAQVTPLSADATPIDNNIGFAHSVTSTILNKSSNSSSGTNINDVIVLEGNEIEIDEVDEYLHYIIRFQNMGITTASNLIITSELSDKLDWSTIKLDKQSHNGDVFILNGNQMSINFNNINLPDSTSDVIGSIGHFAYKIKPKSTIAVGDIITNEAKFYFDSEPVINTNAVATQITADSAGINDTNILIDVSVYPNPVNDKLQIKSDDHNIVSIEIYDVLGKVVLQKNNISGIHELNVSHLNNTVFFLKLIDKNGNFKTEKIIKK